MHEKSRLPDSGRTFKVGVEGRKGARLELATVLGYENDRSITSCGIDDRLSTSRMIPTENSEYTVLNLLGSRTTWGCTQHRLSAMLDEMTCSPTGVACSGRGSACAAKTPAQRRPTTLRTCHSSTANRMKIVDTANESA